MEKRTEPRPLDLIVVGNLAEDIVFGESHLGGSAGDITINATSAGLACGIISSRGNDPFSIRYMEELDRLHIDTSMITPTLAKMPTCIVSSTKNHSSSKEWFDNGSTQSLKQYSFTAHGAAAVARARIIHCTTTPPELIEKIMSLKSDHTLVGYEPGPRVLHDTSYFNESLFERSHIMFMNEEEAAAIFAVRSLTSLQRAMTADQVIVVTRGRAGCDVYRRDSHQHVPALEVVREEDIVDSNGAGDAFRAGFYSALLAGLSVEMCATEANKFGAAAVRTRGAILSIDERYRPASEVRI